MPVRGHVGSDYERLRPEFRVISNPFAPAERLMLGLRLDEPMSLDGLERMLDETELDRLADGGLVVRRGDSLALTVRGRFLGGGVTARLLA